MNEHLKRFLFGGDSQKKDFLAQIKSLVVFTLGFTIAFSWRQTTFDASEKLIQTWINVQNSTYLSVLTSTFITIISIIIIWILIKLAD